MNIRKPLFWHQGLFLQPQHLQYADLHHTAGRHPFHRIASPFFWGVVKLNINENALANDVFEAEGGEFIMPDGALVNYPEDAILPSRSFSSAWTDRQSPFSVFIGIRKMDPKGGNVTVACGDDGGADVTTRFLTEASAREVPDLHQDGPPAQIKTLTHVLRLFWEDEVEEAQDYDILAAARIVQDGDAVMLSPDYIPPCLSLSASAVLLKTVKAIRDELAGRTHQLEEFKTPVGVSGAEVNPRSIPYRFALQLLSYYGPMLFHCVEAASVHPWEVYGMLRQLAGGISSVSDQVNFLGEARDGTAMLPPYRHNDLGTCFKSAHRLLVKLLNELTVSAELLVVLREVETGQFSADLPDEMLHPQNIFFLAVRTVKPVKQYLDSLLHRAKIGSPKKVKTYEEHALPGLPLEHLLLHPEGIPRRPNASFFAVDRRDAAWNAVTTEKSVVVLWDEAPEDVKFELIAMRR